MGLHSTRLIIAVTFKIFASWDVFTDLCPRQLYQISHKCKSHPMEYIATNSRISLLNFEFRALPTPVIVQVSFWCENRHYSGRKPHPCRSSESFRTQQHLSPSVSCHHHCFQPSCVTYVLLHFGHNGKTECDKSQATVLSSQLYTLYNYILCWKLFQSETFHSASVLFQHW